MMGQQGGNQDRLFYSFNLDSVMCPPIIFYVELIGFLIWVSCANTLPRSTAIPADPRLTPSC